DARWHDGVVSGMSKRQRTAPARDSRAGTASRKRPSGGGGAAGFDPAAIAREIVAALADAVVVTGLDNRIITANRAAAELCGRPLEDLPGTVVDELLPIGERLQVAERERRARSGDEQHYETKIVRSGGERDVAVSSTPLMVEGKLLGTVATLRDITDQKRAQDTLARSEARYRNLFESASDAISTF